MKLVSISLYGADPIYAVGAVENARRVPLVYPGWKLRVYCTAQHPAIVELASLGAQVFMAPEPPGTYGMFWRFLAAADSDVDAVVFRDADSRVGPRDAAAVAEWLAGGQRYHVMRDHPDHADWPMLGGMWGVRGGVLCDIRKRIARWGQWDKKLDDMRFLAAEVWPEAQRDMMHHSSVATKHPGARPFPGHAPQNGHVGQIIGI